MSSVQWRRRFADYRAAQAAHDRAWACIDQLQTRLAVCNSDSERAAFNEGIAIAKRRARLASENLAAATDAFTQGRSVVEAIWNAPDDI